MSQSVVFVCFSVVAAAQHHFTGTVSSNTSLKSTSASTVTTRSPGSFRKREVGVGGERKQVCVIPVDCGFRSDSADRLARQIPFEPGRRFAPARRPLVFRHKTPLPSRAVSRVPDRCGEIHPHNQISSEAIALDNAKARELQFPRHEPDVGAVGDLQRSLTRSQGLDADVNSASRQYRRKHAYSYRYPVGSVGRSLPVVDHPKAPPLFPHEMLKVYPTGRVSARLVVPSRSPVPSVSTPTYGGTSSAFNDVCSHILQQHKLRCLRVGQETHASGDTPWHDTVALFGK